MGAKESSLTSFWPDECARVQEVLQARRIAVISRGPEQSPRWIGLHVNGSYRFREPTRVSSGLAQRALARTSPWWQAPPWPRSGAEVERWLLDTMPARVLWLPVPLLDDTRALLGCAFDHAPSMALMQPLLPLLATQVGTRYQLLWERQEHARLRKRMSDSEQRHNLLLDNLADALIVHRVDGVVVDVNAATLTMFGYPRTMLVGGHLDLLQPGMPEDERRRGMNMVAEHGRAHFETVFRRSDGSLFTAEVAASAFDVDGTRYVQGLIRDVSERLQLVRELAAMRDLAEAGTRAKSRFLAHMSHEIRTPMNGVLGMTELLLGTTLGDDQRELLDVVKKSGSALLTIVNEILDLSRVEAGEMQLEQEPFDLHRCIEEAFDVVCVAAARKRLELCYQLAPGVPARVVGDITRLRQVLINLVGNAIEFTDAGSVTVAVEVTEQIPPTPDGDDLHLHFVVRDTGVGIADHQLGQLFNSFYQTKQRASGSGLGLAICKHLVSLMEGEIWAESIMGQGSVMHVTIQVPAAVGDPDVPHLSQAQPVLAGCKVVIAVADASLQRQLLDLLASWQLDAVCATAARLERWQQADEHLHFDLVIVDAECDVGERCLRYVDRDRPPVISLCWVQRLVAGADDRSQRVLELKRPVKPAMLHRMLVRLLAGDAQPWPLPPVEPGDALGEIAERCPLRLLVAEDNRINQKVILSMLERLGYTADLVTSGAEALVAVREHSYDVVLMDVQMPDMDGIEATRRIRQRGELSQPHIIALTARAMTGEREACLAAGMDEFLTKPVSLSALRAALLRSGGSSEAT